MLERQTRRFRPLLGIRFFDCGSLSALKKFESVSVPYWGLDFLINCKYRLNDRLKSVSVPYWGLDFLILVALITERCGGATGFRPLLGIRFFDKLGLDKDSRAGVFPSPIGD